MRIASGRHKGKTLELVALKDPEYIWDLLLSKPRGARQERAQAKARALVETFDRRAFDVLCVGGGCERKATRCTVCKSSVDTPWWWCDACDPWQYGAGRDMLHVLRTYQDVLDFCRTFDDPTVARDLVLTLAMAKGLSKLGETQADLFFHG